LIGSCNTTVVNFVLNGDAASRETREAGRDILPLDVPLADGPDGAGAVDAARDAAVDAVTDSGVDAGSDACCLAPDPSCTQQIKGSEASCDDVGTLKNYVSQACMGLGLQLADYNPSGDCGAGAYRYVSYTCCAVPGQLDSAVPAGGMVSGPAHFIQYKCCLSDTDCIIETQGGDAVCRDASALKALATASCQKNGRSLQNGAYYGACQL
jgi:hypothetical protein